MSRSYPDLQTKPSRLWEQGFCKDVSYTAGVEEQHTHSLHWLWVLQESHVIRELYLRASRSSGPLPARRDSVTAPHGSRICVLVRSEVRWSELALNLLISWFNRLHQSLGQAVVCYCIFRTYLWPHYELWRFGHQRLFWTCKFLIIIDEKKMVSQGVVKCTEGPHVSYWNFWLATV